MRQSAKTIRRKQPRVAWTAGPDLGDQQSLFRCQLWHVTQMRSLRRELVELTAKMEGAVVQRFYDRMGVEKQRCQRALAKHQKFIDAITPFVRAPVKRERTAR